MPNASIAIQVLPQVHAPEGNQLSADVIAVVDKVIAYIKSTGLSYLVCPFETVVEGDLTQLIPLVQRCQEICIEAGADAVYSYVRFVYSPKKAPLSIEEKIGKHRP